MVLLEKQVIKGLLGGVKSFFPFLNRYSGTGGTDDSLYCYAVWFRHLYAIQKAQVLSTSTLMNVLEIGPGESMGVCMSALLTGSKSACAVDIYDHIDRQKNQEICEKIISYFVQKRPIPNSQEFPFLSPKTPDSFTFAQLPIEWKDPSHYSSEGLSLIADFNSQRVQSPLQFLAGNWMSDFKPSYSPTLVIAQGVFQYVDVLSAFEKIASWIAPDGIVSLQVDYSSMGITQSWNGHWALSSFTWKLMQGRRPFFANRLTHSEVRMAALIHGFEVILELKEEVGTAIPKSNWQIQKTRYKDTPDEDFHISRCHFILKKQK